MFVFEVVGFTAALTALISSLDTLIRFARDLIQSTQGVDETIEESLSRTELLFNLTSSLRDLVRTAYRSVQSPVGIRSVEELWKTVSALKGELLDLRSRSLSKKWKRLKKREAKIANLEKQLEKQHSHFTSLALIAFL